MENGSLIISFSGFDGILYTRLRQICREKKLLTLMLLVANLGNTKLCKKKVLNTKMTWFRWFSKILHPCALDESSLSIGSVKNEKSYSQ